MRIYHGSENIIEAPRFGVGNAHNDYGLGFYCTQSKELAKEWACQKNRNGWVNEYELDVSTLSVLDLSDEKYNILHWLSVLMQNRIFSPKSPLGKQNLDFLVQKYSIPYTDYDVIFGYRADDSYFSFASDFLENVIPVQSLASSMKLGKLGIQIVLKSKKAFENLCHTEHEKVPCEIYFSKYKERDTAARSAYLDGLRRVSVSVAVYLVDIVRNPELLSAIRL